MAKLRVGKLVRLSSLGRKHKNQVSFFDEGQSDPRLFLQKVWVVGLAYLLFDLFTSDVEPCRFRLEVIDRLSKSPDLDQSPIEHEAHHEQGNTDQQDFLRVFEKTKDSLKRGAFFSCIFLL